LIAQARRTIDPDVASICGLARLIIEAHNVFLYLGEPNIGEAERDFRFQLMYLNDNVDLTKISVALGIPTQDNRLVAREYFKSLNIDQLQSSPIFAALPEKQRGKLLEGAQAYLRNRYRGPRPVSA